MLHSPAPRRETFPSPIPYGARIELRISRPRDMFNHFWTINSTVVVLNKQGHVGSFRNMGGACRTLYSKTWITSIIRRDDTVDELTFDTDLEVEDALAAAFEADYLAAGVA